MGSHKIVERCSLIQPRGCGFDHSGAHDQDPCGYAVDRLDRKKGPKQHVNEGKV